MKKIAIDLSCIEEPRAGKGNYAFHLSQALFRADNENQYLVFTASATHNLPRAKNIHIHILHSRGIRRHFEIADQCQKNAIDIFFSPSSYITPSLIKKPTKVIFTVHDLVSFFASEGHNFKAKLIEKLFLNRAIRRASQILTVSEHTKKDLCRLSSQATEKAQTIYCSADDLFQSEQSKNSQNYFLAVGTIQPRKNYPNLLRAFEIFSAKNPHFKLHIVGSKGWKAEAFYQQLNESKALKNIQIHGYIENRKLLKLYQNATALVFPSFYEGFGIPLLEAMKSACPVLCSENSSIPEVVGDAAIFFHPKQPKSIAAAMEKIAENKLLRSQLIESGLTQAQKFSWDKSALQLLNLFAKI